MLSGSNLFLPLQEPLPKHPSQGIVEVGLCPKARDDADRIDCEPFSLRCVHEEGAMLTPRQIVEDIRRNQYGIGLPADSAATPVIANMRSKLDRALKLLS